MRDVKGYRQFCGVARTLDVVGDRWSILILRDLFLGPRRFAALQQGLMGISPGVLSQRLRQLLESDLIEKTGEGVYRLTSLGREFEPVVLALGAFGARFLDAPRADDQMDPRWAMLSLKRRFRGTRGKGTVEFAVGQQTFGVRFRETSIDVWDGQAPRWNARGSGEGTAWFSLLSGRQPLSTLTATGAIELDGDKAMARRFLKAIGARLR